ncbi:hypothetical protein ACFL1A_00845 [Patescibacteria group bacterium]
MKTLLTTHKHSINECLLQVNLLFQNFEKFIDIHLPQRLNLKTNYISYIEPVHYGTIMPKEEKDIYLKSLKNHGFKIESRFKSSIVANYLKRKYHRNNIDIQIIKLINSKKWQIELFIPVSGLNKKEWSDEKPYISHFALKMIQKKKGIISNIFLLNGFKLTDKGTNPQEQSTTLYYQKLSKLNKPIKLEVFQKI